MSTTAGLNLSGKFFFSGLCVGTFYLGCWQTQRYFEKISLMDQRKKDLALDPEPLLKTDNELALQGFRRRLVEGRYRHGEEMLMGPRGPPPGALLVASGPASGRSEGGMSSGPQGYYVITPFESTMGRTLLVNRGWIPKNYPEKGIPYPHPTGLQKIVTVPGKGEKPRFMVPQHDLSKRPLRFYWMDVDTMEEVSGMDKGEALLMIQVKDDGTGELQYPAQPPADVVGDYKTTPLIHAGYAVTWYGLAGAGLFMTRKLITRGRA